MRYFTIKELCWSNTAALRSIDNTPSAEVRANLVRLVEKVLDPLREAWGKPIHVNSGYRCPELNFLVRGARSSHHLYGYAADITAGSNKENAKLLELFKSLRLPFTQCINEKPNSAGPTWLHISHKPGELRGQYLTLR